MSNRLPYRDALVAQPDSLIRIAGHVREQLADSRPFTATRPVLVGIGASFSAAAVGVHLLQRRGIAATRVTPGQVGEAVPPLGDLVLAVSQGGRSAETVALLEQWSAVPRAAVVNVPHTPVTAAAEAVVDLGDEPDSHASTTGFTGTLVALALLADCWAGGEPAAVWSDLPDVLAGLSSLAGLDEAASRLGEVGMLDFVGSGVSIGVAEEAALLAREAANLAAYGTDTRTYLHGPMESAGGSGHVFFGAGREAAAATALAERGHPTLLVTAAASAASDALRAQGGIVVVTGTSDERLRPLAETIVVQQLVLQLADSRGADIDTFVYSQSDTKLGESAA